ncbi:MAG TPA: hypothetical protein VK997_13390 [Deferrisomatales bacterium]|nr:hypothetical protein [Deferrisomatales bacterium]
MQEQPPAPAAARPLRRRVVVLPLQPAAGEPFDGTGLALHFLLGNVLALHTGLEEFWFGWRAQKIFPTPQGLRDYCRNAAPPLDVTRVARRQDVRYWLAGRVGQGGAPVLRLQLSDADGTPEWRDRIFAVTTEDGLVALRRQFLGWLAACGLPLPQGQEEKTLWPEESSTEGLMGLGKALETFYCNGYAADPRGIDTDPFERAVAVAPGSYLALDLLGWARYRRLDLPAAREAFTAALEKNPHGVGVLNGLLRCAVQTGDEAGAYRWAEAIATLRGGDGDAQKAAAAQLLAKNALGRGDARAAAALYRKATAWAPTRKLYADGLATALEATGPGTGRAHPSRADR